MTRRTPFTGTSASRRREARKHLQPLEVSSKEWDAAPEATKIELACKRKVMSKPEKATMVRDTPVYDSADNVCLPNVWVYQAGFRKSENVTAR
ncbi:hypothetical protein [Candidatus Symbiopectobacterium sp. NZEC135]|uniref:transcriptional antitermination N peptide n=1 Tax=Candidatus Symbiopectobacterium sp. NZEC135 TaxID=2820471 RepID=UPI002226C558|nr:hypothetical protein [Candidatus Symbiopectobacterium sp. NZEC135]MCW2477717.1 hypothetical protein [Candidatus Symbiopectobacterium sp. NZEC135]